MTTYTHEGTGASTVTSNGARHVISLDFAGTATVDVEKKLPSGNWIKIETGITADAMKEYGEVGGPPMELRTNCTAHTNDVVVYFDRV